MSRRPRTGEDDSRARADLTGMSDLTLLALGYETGFWNDNGRPAPWPDDIDEWSPTTHEPLTFQPGEPPF
jgi:hypothetical protein